MLNETQVCLYSDEVRPGEARPNQVTPNDVKPETAISGERNGQVIIDARKASVILDKRPRNRAWIVRAMRDAAGKYGFKIPDDPVAAAAELFSFLRKKRSPEAAESFSLEVLATLENRYPWTFETDAETLAEQLRREALVVERAWRTIRRLAVRMPVLLLLNESTPRDYLTCRLPAWAAHLEGAGNRRDFPVLIVAGIKISSSEHRASLADSPEGGALTKAVGLAEALNRRLVVVDFSRRRFPRAFLRICRFALQTGWGVTPVGKVRRTDGTDLPGPKSPRGLPRIQGTPTIVLVDPWPVSDSRIASRMRPEILRKFGGMPPTKPWQDDRLGARVEVEAGTDGVYRPVSIPWIVPVSGGWMRADHLFKSRLARYVRMEA